MALTTRADYLLTALNDWSVYWTRSVLCEVWTALLCIT